MGLHIASSNAFFDIISQEIGKMTCGEHLVRIFGLLPLVEVQVREALKALDSLINTARRAEREAQFPLLGNAGFTRGDFADEFVSRRGLLGRSRLWERLTAMRETWVVLANRVQVSTVHPRIFRVLTIGRSCVVLLAVSMTKGGNAHTTARVALCTRAVDRT